MLPLAVTFFGANLTLGLVVILVIGMFIALVFGVVPGLGPLMVIILLIPLLDMFSTPVALLLLGSTFVVSTYGGSISAILLNIPGTTSSAVTTLDGYPMSKRGEAITALAISTSSSLLGGLISVTIILLATPLLAEFILLFGSPEYFMLTMLGIAVIAAISKGNLLKGLIAGFFGLMITSIGFAQVSGEVRYTFGILYLYEGIQYIPAIIGMFAITEMSRLAGRGDQISESAELRGSVTGGIRATLGRWRTVIRSSLIGLFVGVIPGAGGTVANFVSYGSAVSAGDEKESDHEFGDGNPAGIIAAEGSNNAMVPGSLVPMLTFGIPGNAATALMIGALLFLGIRPGPTLFARQIDLVYLMYLGVIVGSLFLLVMYYLAPYFGRVTVTDKSILIPLALSFATISVYALRFSYGDLVQLFVFGVLGYAMVKYNYSVIAFTLGIILGPIAEENLFRSLQLSGGSLDIFVTRPLSLLLLFLSLLIVIFPYISVRDRLGRIASR
jgi:putative tricarboxylic transport membrane protein